MTITELEACMKYKVHMDHNLECTVGTLEESKRYHAHQFQDVVIKNRQNTKK